MQTTTELNQKLERLGIYAACNERPKLTKSFKGFLRYLLLDMPWYWSKCLLNSRYFKSWLRICVAAFIGILLGLLAFIAHDNAILRENQEKYIPLQKSLRTNKDEARAMSTAIKLNLPSSAVIEFLFLIMSPTAVSLHTALSADTCISQSLTAVFTAHFCNILRSSHFIS